ncbi:hypothetical protein [Streptomyces sp. NPDC086182]|uniref:hypothetical protein n=1 Tax=Streptomyces sp. NPDC086182 TaxID=3155058 RepID=UPI003443D5E2
MRHTTTTALLATLLLAGAATGCGSGSSDDKPRAQPSASATPPANPLVQFTNAVNHAQLESYATGIPAFQDLEVFPPQWCKALNEGHSVEWMLGDGGLYPVGQDWGTKKADAYQLVLFGVKAYCPKHTAAVTAELRASGEY